MRDDAALIHFRVMVKPDPESGTNAAPLAYYETYFVGRPQDRDDLLMNREVLFQTFAFEKANIRAIQSLGLDRARARVLDVGCGSGAGLLSFMRWGFPSANLSGIDLNSARVARARSEIPRADIREGDATAMPFGDGAFDVVFESTMFLQMTDDVLALSIAHEMIRVARAGGFIVLADWRYGKPGRPEFSAVSQSRIANLFDVGGSTVLRRIERGALIPPIGRFLSRALPGLYFAVQATLPFLAGQTTTVLQKRSDSPGVP